MSDAKKIYRPIYERIKGESEQEVDKYIKYLSGGGLVLSLSFIGSIMPKVNADYLCVIVIGWVLLILSLISNFISHFITIANIDKTIKDIDEEKDNWIENAYKRNKPIKWVNRFSACMSIIGIIAITLFVTLNINNYGKASNTTKTKSNEPRTGQKSEFTDTTITYKQTQNKEIDIMTKKSNPKTGAGRPTKSTQQNSQSLPIPKTAEKPAVKESEKK